MFTRLAERLGIDPLQWRVLTAAYLRMDLRVSGGATPHRGRTRRGGSPLVGLVVITGIGSIMFALLSFSITDVLLAASLLTTYGAASTMMLLLVDFTALVVSPNDYAVLGHRPVGSRTYFAARLASVAAYISVISTALAFMPALVFAIFRGAGPLGFLATVLAVVLCDLVATVCVIAGYSVLLHYVHPSRLRRVMSYFHLVAVTVFYAAYYAATVGFRSAFLTGLEFDSLPWLWIVPTTWFAAFVPVASGLGTLSTAAASAIALIATAACVPLASGRLSLEYAQRIGEIGAAAEPIARGRALSIPGFGRGEARAVALLVRAQFRFDQRFRMAILSILPLTLFYVMLGLNDGALTDPFDAASGTRATGPGLYFAVVFLPMTLHTALSVSESWRAGWIFFAAPASHARLVVATKNFVTVYFLGAYLVALALLWSFVYERVWHALVHAIFAGLIAHFLLQLAVMISPKLPFAAEPRRAERSAGLLAVIFVATIASALMPMTAPVVYSSATLTISVFLLFACVTAGMEYALRLRVEEVIGDLEFRS